MFIPCREDECLKLYELAKDKLPATSYVEFQLTSKGLVIEAYGYETDVKALWFELKKLLPPLKEALSTSKKVKKYEVGLVAKIIQKTFPPLVLVEVLKHKGYHARFLGESNSIESNASLEEVLEVASKVAELNIEAGKISRNTSTRYYIAALSALTGLPVEEVARLSVKHGLLREEGGVYVVTLDWREALNKALKTLVHPQ